MNIWFIAARDLTTRWTAFSFGLPAFAKLPFFCFAGSAPWNVPGKTPVKPMTAPNNLVTKAIAAPVGFESQSRPGISQGRQSIRFGKNRPPCDPVAPGDIPRAFQRGGTGRGAGVGRTRGVGISLGVGLELGVGVDVAVTVGLAVGVAVGLGTAKAYTLLSPAT